MVRNGRCFNMELILSILLVYGITNIIVRGSIFDSSKDKLEDVIVNGNAFFRKMSSITLKLSNCPMCAGFWVGAAVGAFYGPYNEYNILFNGAFYSGTCWLLHCITQYLGQGEKPEQIINIYNGEEYEEEENNKKEVLLG